MFFKKLRFANLIKREELTAPDNTAQNRARIAVDMSVPGQWTAMVVPPAKLGSGVVDEGMWPRLVRLDGFKKLMERDEWDKLKLAGTHDCTIPTRGFPTATRKRAVAGRAPRLPVSFGGWRSPQGSVVSRARSAMSIDAPSVLSSRSAPRNAHGKRPKVRLVEPHPPKRVRETRAVLVKTEAARALRRAQRAAYVAARRALIEQILLELLLEDAAKQRHEAEERARVAAEHARVAAEHARMVAQMKARLKQMDEEERLAREEFRRREEEEARQRELDEARQREVEQLRRRLEEMRLQEEAHIRELEEMRRREAERLEEEERKRLGEERRKRLEEERRRSAAAFLERRLHPEALTPQAAYKVWQDRLAHFKEIRKSPEDIHVRDIPCPVLYRPEYSLHIVNESTVSAFFAQCEQFLTEADLKVARTILHPDVFRKDCATDEGYTDEGDITFIKNVVTTISAQVNSIYDALETQRRQ